MEPIRPDYAGPCVNGIMRPLLGGRTEPWFPGPVTGAEATVLFVVDGLGWNMLQQHRERAPVIAGMEGGPITTTVPSTTTVALTSITTGLPPSEHGVVGYRMHLGQGVLNLLRWSVPQGMKPPQPADLQPRLAFDGVEAPAITKAEFRKTGFTEVHLRGARFFGAHSISSLVEHCRALTAAGERFVYAYYGDLDLVCHMRGMHDGFLAAEIAFVDRLVGDLLAALPAEVALVLASDHGHVHIKIQLETTQLKSMLTGQGGEGRFRVLHAKRGATEDLLSAATDLCSSQAWVFSSEQLFDDGWLGPPPSSAAVRRRLGDVVIAARDPVVFMDPANPGERKLLTGHGSLTADEMLVPLLAARGIQ